MRLRKAVGGALLLIGGVVAGVLLSEAAYRVARRFVCVGAAPGAAAQVRSWGWTHKPRSEGWAFACVGRRYEWQTYVRINSHGLRGPEVAYAKPAGVRRVLLLGDSITEAIQVPFEKTFAARLGRDLRDDRIDVVNAGHAGFGTDNELLFYEEEGRRYDPDLVVQVFNLDNDVLENSQRLFHRAYERAAARWPPKPSFQVAADGTLQKLPAPPPTPYVEDRSWWGWLAARFFVLRSLERALAAPPPDPVLYFPVNYESFQPWDDTWNEAWALTMRLTQELRSAVERDGHRFAVVVMPSKQMVDPLSFFATLRAFGQDPAGYDVERPRRPLIEFLRVEGVAFLDVSPELAAATAAGTPTFFAVDVHLNEDGHAAVAPAITAFVRRQLEAGEKR